MGKKPRKQKYGAAKSGELKKTGHQSNLDGGAAKAGQRKLTFRSDGRHCEVVNGR